MIKKLFLVILFGFSFSLLAQQEKLSLENQQKYSFEQPEKKTDSLKIIKRQKHVREITGNWKMLTTESWALREPSDSVVGKMITIEPSQISFLELYPKVKKWSLVKTEKIIFSDKENLTSNPLLMVYSNKEVWQYFVDENSGNLIATYIGEENENGISELVCSNPQLKYFKLQ
ncbi:MAG: hypothetical protein J7574_00990 [Flavobacterium sp.]|uniref:hypothetical protein n=1 Tax=Flavobacterium sp. TaxID=239 RepID=UPI001B1452E8|nr:hypothetical protein [Flavobacterium sp.]MBO9582712.1 hypothetical protein [Flavobacterium sp.]